MSEGSFHHGDRSCGKIARGTDAMRLLSGSSGYAAGLNVGDLIGATVWAPARVSAATAQRIVALAIVPMVAVSVWLALSSEHLQRPVASALYWGYLTAAPMAIGLYWGVRRPASRFGPLLVAVARGIYPQLLEQGLRGALVEVARRSATPVSVRGEWRGRHSEAVETTAYFCCVECLQNAAKHAGGGASATIRLGENDGLVSFSVEDDGVGFDPATAEHGSGLTHLADRVAAVGGTLQIDATPGRGTRITGQIPDDMSRL
jgi:hypothetical protein